MEPDELIAELPQDEQDRDDDDELICPVCGLPDLACMCVRDRAGRRRRVADVPTRGLL